jgi:hypothetical protein
MNTNNMSPLTKVVYDKLKPGFASTGAKGTIISYDYVSKMASVRAPNPYTNQLADYHLVPVEDHGRGIHLRALKPGTRVWVSFSNGVTPTITSIMTERSTKSDLKVYYGPQINRYTSYI